MPAKTIIPKSKTRKLTTDQRRWLTHERQLCKTEEEWRQLLLLRYSPQEVAAILEYLAAADEEVE